MNRPSEVPNKATWCEEDSEWVLGPKDAKGEYHGDVHYWRPDGTLVCICAISHGVPHGQSRRFHQNGEVSVFSTFVKGELDGEQTWQRCKEPTTEGMPTDVTAIWRVKLFYDGGNMLSFRYFLEDDTEVSAKGAPLIRHPEAVPDDATQVSTGWVAGNWNSSGQKHGELTYYDLAGNVASVEMWSNDQLHGALKLFYEDGVRRSSTEYQDGELEGSFEQYARSGAILRRGGISRGEWSGPLQDFDKAGELVETQTFEMPDASPVPQGPSTHESALFDGYSWPFAHGVFMPPPKWSSAALGSFIAVGWGGTEERDATRSRIARAIIRAAAKNNSGLARALQELGLDNAPRLLTGARLERLRQAMMSVPEVDAARMDCDFATEGGVGATVALRSGGSEAAQVLRSKLSGSGTLDLAHESLRQLPWEVCCLPTLTKIDASHNGLVALPEAIGSLPFLQNLSLEHNRVSELPASMARLREFHSLSLVGNGLQKVPEVLAKLSELTTLNLGENQLTELPKSFADLSQLETLWLSNNPLTGLPQSFGELPNLRFLHLGSAPWATPPDCIWELENLEVLWLASTSLSYLPPDVARLKKLKKLHLWYSNLEELPECLFGMTQLTELRVRDNPLPEGTIDRLREALPNTTIY